MSGHTQHGSLHSCATREKDAGGSSVWPSAAVCVMTGQPRGAADSGQGLACRPESLVQRLETRAERLLPVWRPSSFFPEETWPWL